MDITFENFFELYGLESLKATLEENKFKTMRAVMEITNEDLKEMGVNALGERKEFLAAVKDVKDKLSNVGDKPEASTKSTSERVKRKLDLQDVHQSHCETPEKKGKSEAESSPISLSNWLQSPFDPAKVLKNKKIQLYSKEDIARVYGLRKKKMEFINNKLLELIKDPTVRSKNKTAIIGMAESAWDKYNASDVSIDVVEVKTLLNSLEGRGKSHTSKQISTITKLTERLNKAKSDIRQQISRIDNLKQEGKDKEIEILEDDLVLLHYELQKATDSLRKACEVKMSELKAMLDGDDDKSESEDQDNVVEERDGDISDTSIVDEIKEQGDVVDDENSN